jgi:hypothetical protein
LCTRCTTICTARCSRRCIDQTACDSTASAQKRSCRRIQGQRARRQHDCGHTSPFQPARMSMPPYHSYDAHPPSQHAPRCTHLRLPMLPLPATVFTAHKCDVMYTTVRHEDDPCPALHALSPLLTMPDTRVVRGCSDVPTPRTFVWARVHYHLRFPAPSTSSCLPRPMIASPAAPFHAEQLFPQPAG